MVFSGREPGKYGNKKKVASDGSIIDSKRECSRYEDLIMLQRCGEIHDLRRQVKYQLIPSQPEFGERPCSYIADFVYVDKGGVFHVEDSKGFKTREYKIKRKLMAMVHHIEIEEV